MEAIGDPIAPELKNQAPIDPQDFLDKILKNIKLLWKQGLVHGDLSAFNILNDSEEPIFIDFSQATTTKSSDAKDLLLRDLKNIAAFFKKLSIDLDVDKEFNVVVG